jgi:hypothetical protein
MALADGGVATFDESTSTLTTFDDDGQLQSTTPMPLSNPSGSIKFGRWYGRELMSGEVASVVGPVLEEARSSATVQSGNPQKQQAPYDADAYGIFARSYWIALGVTGRRHLGIKIVPTDQTYWRGQRPTVFAQRDIRGLWFATIGGESSTGNCSGVLLGTVNRSQDLGNPTVELEHLQYSPILENQLIQSVLDRDSQYPDSLEYGCLPDFPLPDNQYNSNSYARGLLNATDIPLPSFPFEWYLAFPGWFKPVPRPLFGPQ